MALFTSQPLLQSNLSPSLDQVGFTMTPKTHGWGGGLICCQKENIAGCACFSWR